MTGSKAAGTSTPTASVSFSRKLEKTGLIMHKPNESSYKPDATIRLQENTSLSGLPLQEEEGRQQAQVLESGAEAEERHHRQAARQLPIQRTHTKYIVWVNFASGRGGANT